MTSDLVPPRPAPASDADRPAATAANLPIVGEASPPPVVAALYDQFRDRFGRPRVPGILQCFATHPPLLEHMMGLAETMLFNEGALGRQHKEMLATYVSAANLCAYCADSHGFSLLSQGGSPDLLEAALACNRDAPALTPRQRVWLGFIDTVNRSSASINPADIEALRHHGWTDLEIAETIHLTALFATFNRVVNAFGVSSQNLLQTATTTPLPASGSASLPPSLPATLPATLPGSTP